jgi:hypothetical protein
MSNEISIEQLLRWRAARAEAEAPPAPRAARLLELARPWWEAWPERFHLLVERLGSIQITYGHAMAEPVEARRSGYPVPTLIVRGVEELETSVSVLYLGVRDARLRLRFQLESALAHVPKTFEVTFVAQGSARPLLSAPAVLSVDREYRIDCELPAELGRDWKELKVTDRMPFRLILRSDKDGS